MKNIFRYKFDIRFISERATIALKVGIPKNVGNLLIATETARIVQNQDRSRFSGMNCGMSVTDNFYMSEKSLGRDVIYLFSYQIQPNTS